jgi:hypothetical protein
VRRMIGQSAEWAGHCHFTVLPPTSHSVTSHRHVRTFSPPLHVNTRANHLQDLPSTLTWTTTRSTFSFGRLRR